MSRSARLLFSCLIFAGACGSESVSKKPVAVGLVTGNPLSVVLTYPEAGAENLVLGTKVLAVFSRGVDTATLNESSFRLTAGTTEIASAVSYDTESRTAILTPSERLAPETEYTVTVAASVADGDGVSLAEDVTWSFSTAAAQAPGIVFTSPADGARIIGERAISVAAYIDGNLPLASVSGTRNGTSVPVLESERSIEWNVTLDDRSNLLELTVRDQAGNEAKGAITVNYPFLSFANGDAAEFVIGQVDFSGGWANRGGSATEATLQNPWSLDVRDGRLLIADYLNHRVLGYSALPVTNGESADFVIGQPDFTSESSSSSSLVSPHVVHAADQWLYVLDSENRVLIYDDSAAQPATWPTFVLGQPDMATTSAGCLPYKHDTPWGLFAESGKLLLADSNNHRVLIWHTLPTTWGTEPDLVLGQTDFTSCEANQGAARPSKGTLNEPDDVWTDGTRLLVVDYLNERVLGWHTFPTAISQPADFVLGQPNGVTNATPVSPTAFNMKGATKVNSNGNQIFVTDTLHNRVLIWDGFPDEDGVPADRVLGQASLDTGTDGAGAAGLNDPGGVAFGNDGLFVTDFYNNRVLFFRP